MRSRVPRADNPARRRRALERTYRAVVRDAAAIAAAPLVELLVARDGSAGPRWESAALAAPGLTRGERTDLLRVLSRSPSIAELPEPLSRPAHRIATCESVPGSHPGRARFAVGLPAGRDGAVGPGMAPDRAGRAPRPRRLPHLPRAGPAGLRPARGGSAAARAHGPPPPGRARRHPREARAGRAFPGEGHPRRPEPRGYAPHGRDRRPGRVRGHLPRAHPARVPLRGDDRRAHSGGAAPALPVRLHGFSPPLQRATERVLGQRLVGSTHRPAHGAARRARSPPGAYRLHGAGARGGPSALRRRHGRAGAQAGAAARAQARGRGAAALRRRHLRPPRGRGRALEQERSRGDRRLRAAGLHRAGEGTALLRAARCTRRSSSPRWSAGPASSPAPCGR